MQLKIEKGFYESIFNLTVLVAGLGYFVDTFDYFLYGSMRTVSLTELGLSGDAITQTGILILNFQIIGMLLGSFFWGILGDKIGRKKGLLGSIFLYSIGMIANAFVHDVNSYTIVRFLIGFGLGGELGLGATLVAETIQTSRRTYALALFTALGVLGIVCAAFSIEFVNWRIACAIGGGLGLILLLLRSIVFESKIYIDVATTNIKRGSLRELFSNWQNIRNYICCILILLPNTFIIGMFLTLSPEVAKAIQVQGAVKANIAMAAYFTMAVIGDLFGAALSNLLKSRRLAVGIFSIGNLALAAILLLTSHLEAWQYYIFAGAFGLFNLWALEGTVLVELFPTHLRGTATASGLVIPRSISILINLSFLALKFMGPANALLIIGGIILCVSLFAVWGLPESYNRSLSTP